MHVQVMKIKVHTIKVSKWLMKNYCYVVQEEESGDAVLVDPALDRRAIEAKLEKTGSKLKAILVTHVHPDHIGLVEVFARKCHIPVWLSQVEKNFYEFEAPNLNLTDACEPFRCGELEVHPFFTPGHTKGSLCYLVGSNFFSGDTLFAEGCGICQGRGADPEEMFESLMLLKQTISPETRIYPGHSFGKLPGMKFGEVLKSNLYLQIDKKETFVKIRMRLNFKSWFRFQYPDEEVNVVESSRSFPLE